MQMLMEETDDEHGLTMADIIDRLDERGISAERKSVYSDIALLREFGLDIITRGGGKAEYFIGSREFEHPEITLLIDAVQSSKFLTERKSAQLIDKLKTLVSVHDARNYDRQVYVAGRVKMQNESVFYNVDAIQRALNAKRKISFKYYDYDFSKKKVARKDGSDYIVNPMGLTYVDEYYYLVAYTEKHDNFTSYRVDRMMKLAILEEPSVRAPERGRFNMREYCQRSFGMFGGEDIMVELTFHRALMNVMVDRFGKDVRVERIDAEFLEAILEQY
jgi:predicted DNA-binding transcriptional regulator YafY